MKKTTLLVIGLVFGGLINAQNFTDALRYSEMETQGTARYTAMGGSFSALGGEVSALSKNPAGIGIYRNSEFTFSTAFNTIDTESRYLGETRSDGGLNFNIPNISYVGSYKGDANSWKNYSFGLSYNRITTFNEESRLAGNSTNSTIINDYLDILNNDNAVVDEVSSFQYPFGPSEAWDVLMIDTLTNNSGQLTYVPLSVSFYGVDPSNIEQSRASRTKGNQSETAFTFGGNYQDRWFIGGGIGFQRVRFDREYTYTERYTFDGIVDPNEFYVTEYSEEISQLILGTGVNFKFGVIYRFSDAFRLGGAIHSPTYFGFSEEFVYESNSKFINGSAENSGESISDFDYRLRTPARFIGSLAYLFMNKAAINFEYEFVDYATAKLNDSQNSAFDYSPQNEGIESTLNSAHNVRLGAEIKEGPFVFRGGFKYSDNPFNSSIAFNPNENRKTYSLGGGYRSKNYNIDVAYSTFKRNSLDQIYASNPEVASIESREHNLVFTIGWRW